MLVLKQNAISAWHFTPGRHLTQLYGGPPDPVGPGMRHHCKLSVRLCQRGFHASPELEHALLFASVVASKRAPEEPLVLSQVLCWGDVKFSSRYDKLVASDRQCVRLLEVPEEITRKIRIFMGLGCSKRIAKQIRDLPDYMWEDHPALHWTPEDGSEVY